MTQSIIEKRLLPASLFAFVFILGITQIIESDTFWHVKTGEIIVKNLSIPRTDPFTFTMEGEPWADTEWLSQVVFYAVHALAGFNGLIIFKAFIIAMAYLVLYFWRSDTPLLTFPLILLIAAASRLNFYERPKIFTFLFLAVFLVIIERYREGKGRSLLALPALMVPWANLHPGCVFGLILYGTIVLGEVVKRIGSGRWLPEEDILSRRKLRNLTVFFILTGLASFANPNTYRIYSFLYSHVGNEAIGKAFVSEYLPLSFSDSSTSFPLFLMIGLAGLTLAGIAVARKKSDLTPLLLLPVFGVPALYMRRFVAEFFIAGSPAFLWALRSVFLPLTFTRALAPLRSVVLIALAFTPLPLYLHIKATDYYHFLGLGIHHQFYPDKAMEFMDSAGITGNIFNSQNYGGPLIFRYYPRRKVFMDTRHISYEILLPRLSQAMQNASRFDMLLSLYKIDAALVESERRGRFIEKGLFPRNTWALVYWDDLSEVFVRRTDRYAAVISANEYTVTNSETIIGSSGALARDPAAGAAAMRELERLLGLNPYVSKARYALGILHGNSAEAVAQLTKALDIEPSLAEAHEALARIDHVSGRFSDALSHYRKALTLEKAFGAEHTSLAALLNEMGVLSLKMGKPGQAGTYLKEALEYDPSNPGIRTNLRSALSQAVDAPAAP